MARDNGVSSNPLTALTAVDGAGSLLDADFLDGISSASFALSATTVTAAGLVTGGGDLSTNRTLTVTAATAANAKDTTNVATALTPGNLLDVGAVRLLFTLASANMNSTADQNFTKVGTFTTWTPVTARALNGSTSLTTAIGGIYRTASKVNTIVAATQAYTGITGANGTGQGISLNGVYGSGIISETPILSLTTPQGGAATADLYIWGIPLT